MAVTYTWDCRTVDTYPSHTDENGVAASDVIFNVHWRLTGSEGEHSATAIGTQTLEVADLASFTSFDDLTHDDICGWVEAAMDADMLQSQKDSLASQLVEMATPSVVTRHIEDAAPEEEAPAE